MILSGSRNAASTGTPAATIPPSHEPRTDPDQCQDHHKASLRSSNNPQTRMN
jgi:hypothetical protein